MNVCKSAAKRKQANLNDEIRLIRIEFFFSEYVKLGDEKNGILTNTRINTEH